MGAVGGALLATAGYAAGSRNAGVRGVGSNALVGDNLLTATEFSTYYENFVKGMSCAEVLQTNNNIMDSAAAGEPTKGIKVPQQVIMYTWYKNSKTDTSVMAKAQKAMQGGVDECSASPSSKAAPAVTPPVPTGSSFLSYKHFGQEYSHQTAGKPWPEIMRIDELVRESHLALGASVAVKKLNHWYHHHATAAERKDFDDNAVAHMKMGAHL